MVNRNTVLPKSVSPDYNRITHLCWDDFDLNEETPSGVGTTHSAHDIVNQETTADNVNQNEARERQTPSLSCNNKKEVGRISTRSYFRLYTGGQYRTRHKLLKGSNG